MHWVNDNVVHNYGWSIVVITVVINLLMLPLRLSQHEVAEEDAVAAAADWRDQRQVQGPQPARPQEGKSRTQEVMELYKKEGVNPMGGCLPMLVQLPLIYAFYKVLAVTIELRGAHWLWVTDLSQPETLPIHILPIIMIVTQFIVAEDDAQPRHGSLAGQNDAVYAADVWLLFL